jgi:hypothetical protein
LSDPITNQVGFEMFDPFFTELRYAMELDKLDSVWPSDVVVLAALVKALQPFMNKIPMQFIPMSPETNL